jgi:hypothetical protein
MWTKQKESTRPSIQRITGLAVLVLDEAAGDAATKPIRRTPAHRLALAWLTYMGFASTTQADDFWKLLGHVGSYTGRDGQLRRNADARVMLEGWRRRTRER